MTITVKAFWSWLRKLVPSDSEMEAAAQEKREKALRDFLNRQERLRAERNQLRESIQQQQDGGVT